MTWIRVIDEESAEGKLQEAYATVSRRRGKVANIMRAHSLHPETMLSHLELYRSIMFGRSPLPRQTRELIATVVSTANRCGYCVAHHTAALQFYLRDPALVGQIAKDYTRVELSKQQRAILDYAEKLTLTPSGIGAEDVERLRSAGLSDEEILDVNLIVAYMNFVNRVATGLGVEFNAEEARGYRY